MILKLNDVSVLYSHLGDPKERRVDQDLARAVALDVLGGIERAPVDFRFEGHQGVRDNWT